MKIVYKDSLYRIDFFSYIKIYILKFTLILKRIKRLLKRLISYNIQSIIISIIIIIISIIFIVIGLKLKEYKSLLEGIWDFRSIWLTSIIITLTVNTINKEKDRHNDLLEQYTYYIDLNYISEEYIKSILDIISINYNNDIFSNDNMHSKFKNFVENKKIIRNDKLLNELNINVKDYFTFISNQYIKRLYVIKSYMLKIKNENSVYYAIEQINYCLEEIEKEMLKICHMKENNILKEIFDFSIISSNSIIPIIDFIRIPWRWDYKINNKVLKILKDKGNLIEEFYYK